MIALLTIYLEYDMSKQSYSTDGFAERGPQLLSDRSALTICRPVASGFEAAELGFAVGILHTGNVVRHLLRRMEPVVGLLGKLGMSENQRLIIDYRPGKMPL